MSRHADSRDRGRRCVEEYPRPKTASARRKEAHEQELSARELLMNISCQQDALGARVRNVFRLYRALRDGGLGAVLSQGSQRRVVRVSGFSTLVIEFSGAAGMLSMGWLSDKLGAAARG